MEVLGIDKNTIIINNLQASIINQEQAINFMDKFVEVDKLSDSDRGEAGHGSTGK